MCDVARRPSLFSLSATNSRGGSPTSSVSWGERASGGAMAVRVPSAAAAESGPSSALSDDCCFAPFTFGNACAEPPAAVLAFLCRLPKPTGLQLFEHLGNAARLLRPDAESLPLSSSGSRRIGHVLRDVHATILEVDDDLTDCQASPADAEAVCACRQWLKQLQAFVLGLQKDIEYLAMGQPGFGQPALVWRLLEDAHAKLQRLAAAQEAAASVASAADGDVDAATGSSGEAAPDAEADADGAVEAPPAPTPAEFRYKAVCRSWLPYSRHWAGKQCL